MGNFFQAQGPSDVSVAEIKLSPVVATFVITGFVDNTVVEAVGATVGSGIDLNPAKFPAGEACAINGFTGSVSELPVDEPEVGVIIGSNVVDEDELGVGIVDELVADELVGVIVGVALDGVIELAAESVDEDVDVVVVGEIEEDVDVLAVEELVVEAVVVEGLSADEVDGVFEADEDALAVDSVDEAALKVEESDGADAVGE